MPAGLDVVVPISAAVDIRQRNGSLSGSLAGIANVQVTPDLQ
jgi:hypothetical protein